MIYIFGYGEMAKAIAEGIKNKLDFAVVGRNEEKLKRFSLNFNCKYYLLDDFDITDKDILLCIKPYALQEVGMRIKGKANNLISILAGKSLVELEKYIKAKSYARVMPNVAAKYKASTSAICGDEDALKLAKDIFSQIGEVVVMQNDDEIDLATAIIGSGPAFLAIVAEAIADGGVYNGLKREKANELTKGLFKSFAAMQDPFSNIKDNVMSPKGTTAEGIFTLEDEKVRGAFIKAVKNTYEKSKKL